MDIDDLYRDTFFFQDAAGFYCLPLKLSAGEDGDVGAFREDLGLTELEGQLIGDDRPYGAAKPEVDGTCVIGNGYGGGFGLCIVAWYDYGHARQHLHQSDVFQYLVG